MIKKIFFRVLAVIIRILAVLLIAFVFAVIGFIAYANLAGIYELISGHPFVFNGRESVEVAGPIGFVLGALIGLVGSGVYLFSRRAKKISIDILA